MAKLDVNRLSLRRSEGFSLVELAMALLIIGLLVAAVLQGQELVKNAKVSRTISQANEYFRAVNSFENLYGGLPGDLANARSEIPGCMDNPTCQGGDGNGVINEDGGDGTDWLGWSTSAVASLSSESVQFWTTLALAELIDGVDVDFTGTDFAWGRSHPRSAFGGGIEFFYDNATLLGTAFHTFRFSRGAIRSGTPVRDQYIVSPLVAYMIDRKADDGLAWQGKIIVDYGARNTICHNYDVYKIQETQEEACILFFMLYN
ncbi:MAG TPA: hypothetical protein DIU06_03480 [Rhodospirillaceae bacterium]|nr:hypothetical protein [Rhodospirillaceae bacterium]